MFSIHNLILLTDETARTACAADFIFARFFLKLKSYYELNLSIPTQMNYLVWELHKMVFFIFILIGINSIEGFLSTTYLGTTNIISHFSHSSV